MRLLELISKYLRNVKVSKIWIDEAETGEIEGRDPFLSSDATTSDADPIANERIGGPVVGKNTMRVESGVLEGEQ